MNDSATKQISVVIPYDLWVLCKKKEVNVRATVIEALTNKIQELMLNDLKQGR